jgi:hypothetical protein
MNFIDLAIPKINFTKNVAKIKRTPNKNVISMNEWINIKKEEREEKMNKPRNIIGWIQGGLKKNELHISNFGKPWISVNDVYNYLYSKGFKKNTEEIFMAAMQRMVRAKYKGYEKIKALDGFISLSNPNKKSK